MTGAGDELHTTFLINRKIKNTKNRTLLYLQTFIALVHKNYFKMNTASEHDNDIKYFLKTYSKSIPTCKQHPNSQHFFLTIGFVFTKLTYFT